MQVKTERPDPRLASSWCREGVAHDHAACGVLWNSSDQSDVEQAARWADDRAAARRASEDRDTVGKLAVEHVINTLGLDEAAARRILNMMTEAELAKLRESVQKLAIALRSIEPDPMPVFVIKGKDKLAPRAVDAYAQLCDTLGLDEQRREVELAAEEIRGWQQRHRDLVKLPDHTHVPARKG